MKEKKDSVPKIRCEAVRDFPLSKKLPGPEISFLGEFPESLHRTSSRMGRRGKGLARGHN